MNWQIWVAFVVFLFFWIWQSLRHHRAHVQKPDIDKIGREVEAKTKLGRRF